MTNLNLNLPAEPTYRGDATLHRDLDDLFNAVHRLNDIIGTGESGSVTPAQQSFLNGLNLPALTSAAVNFVQGASSNIQTQLNAKADTSTLANYVLTSTLTSTLANYAALAGATFTGTVTVNNTIYSSGTTGAVPTSGAGTRFMWIPSKAAIRAGQVDGTQWDSANIGTGSAAFGWNNTASGTNCLVAGYNNTVIGNYNFVAGSTLGVSAGSYNIVGGLSNTLGATGATSYCFVTGNNLTVDQCSFTTVLGSNITAIAALYSLFAGANHTANSGSFSYQFALGNTNVTGANNTVAIGNYVSAIHGGAIVIGKGSSSGTPFASNALRQIIMGINTTIPVIIIDATGLGFFGTATAAKQTVTGAKGGNAALGSLLTALAAYGLITDSSTA